MFKRKKIESFPAKISICKEVLEAIYNECDQNNIDETGGRIIGYYRQHGSKLDIEICGLICSGPNARRSPTSFFQDGEYQENIFRKIESEYPRIEHIGNWHTHHVNGLTTLSSGDIETYRRIVNHKKHNTDFFYALLVVAKNHTSNKRKRYTMKHFLFKRGVPLVYEIPDSQVRITKERSVFVDKGVYGTLEEEPVVDPVISAESIINQTRAMDREFISEMYPGLKTFFSKQTNSLYWRGKLNLVDGSDVEILILESAEKERPSYSVTLATSSSSLFQCQQPYLEKNFDSAWKAAYLFERDLNRELFEKTKK